MTQSITVPREQQSMTTDRVCPVTGEQLDPDHYVSVTAVRRLRQRLKNLVGLMTDLDDAVGKRLRFSGPSDGGKSSDRPLPINLSAAEAAYAARQTLLVWVDQVARVRGHAVPSSWTAIGRYLTDAADWLSRHPDGPQAFDEILDALSIARRTVDRPAERKYAGPCGALIDDGAGGGVTCDGELYARAGAAEVECPRCGTAYDVEGRRAWMLERLEDALLPAAEMSRALYGLGVGVTSAMVRGWRHRGLLSSNGDSRRGQPLYRVGDVISLALAPTKTTDREGVKA
ncbi:hypothetical protein V2J56_09120 [Georgenia sp. MJ206]|uniref:hypothetical protein n=1 Tax=Georgenia wangjunii TaxID=3117730 RepID=UPI002F2633E1